MEPGKISLSLGAKPKKAPLQPPAAGFSGAARDEDEEKPATAELISQMVGGQVDGKKEQIKVIPAMQNTFALGGAQHLRGALENKPEAEEPAEGAMVPAVPAASAAAEAPAAPPESEDAQAANSILAELRAGGSSIFGGGAEADDTERYRLDVATRADASEMEAYENMPIEDFGKAYLRGLGWEDGGAVGNGKIVEPIEYVPRPQLLGLGAAPKADEKKERDGKHKKYIKPGESREAKKDMIYVDEAGRQRHVKKVGDKLVQREASGFQKGALLAITAGVHKDLYGRVQSTGGMDADIKVVLKLVSNGEEVTVSASQCNPVRDAQLERAKPGFTHQQQRERSGESGGAAVAPPAGGDGGGGDDDEEERRRRKRHKERDDRDRERERDRDRDRDRRDRDRDRDRREERDRERRHGRDERDRSTAAVISGSSNGGGSGSGSGGASGGAMADTPMAAQSDAIMRSTTSGGSGGASGGASRWVRESIRVRVVDKRLDRGALYNKKGVVVDVSGADSFSVRMDESGRLHEGLTHAHVETALPKRGGTVMLLAGPHKMRRGTLIERRSDAATASVQLGGDLQIVECSFEQVAEWVGILGNSLDVADL